MKVGNSKDSHSIQSSKNELYKARLAQANSVEMKRIQDKQAQEHLALVTEMRHLSSQMVGINFTTINYEKIVEMLQETLVLLSRLREQWNHFIRFYSHISNQITSMVDGSLKSFLKASAKGTHAERSKRKELVNYLKGDASSVHHTAYVIYVMPRTYYEVSSRYLLDRPAGLSEMLTVRNDEERTVMMKKLADETKSVTQQVEALIQEQQKEINEAVRKQEIEIRKVITKSGDKGATDLAAIQKGKQMSRTDNPCGRPRIQ
ncbi:unnamed protein product [Rotaria sp. Silwood1]|nr:unnamed protein product [Rotaria sp. Silwood1]